MFKLFLVLLLLAYYNVNGQGFQGGTMSYRIMSTKSDNIIVRFYHKFLQYRPTNADAKICTDSCSTGRIPADELRYKRTNAPKEEIKNLNASFYCDVYNKVDNILIGSIETDVSLSRAYDVYEFTYLGDCCTHEVPTEIRPTYRQAKFQLDAKLNAREDNNQINNPPDSRFAPLYIEMKFATNNTRKLNFPDSNGDLVRCEWSSNTCAANGICNVFTLNSDCTLTLSKSVTAQLFSVGILVKDFPKNATTFTTPYSTVPFYMIVNVLNDGDNANRTAYECPEAKSRPIQNKMSNSNILKISLPFCLFYSIICLISSNLMKY